MFLHLFSLTYHFGVSVLLLLHAWEPWGDCAKTSGCLPRRAFSLWPSQSKGLLSVAPAPPALVGLEPGPWELLSVKATPLVLVEPETKIWPPTLVRPRTPGFGVTGNLGRLEPPGRIDVDVSGCTRRRLEGRPRPTGHDDSPESYEGWPRLRAHLSLHSSASSYLQSHFPMYCSAVPLSDSLRGLVMCERFSLRDDPAPQEEVRRCVGQ